MKSRESRVTEGVSVSETREIIIRDVRCNCCFVYEREREREKGRMCNEEERALWFCRDEDAPYLLFSLLRSHCCCVYGITSSPGCSLIVITGGGVALR